MKPTTGTWRYREQPYYGSQPMELFKKIQLGFIDDHTVIFYDPQVISDEQMLQAMRVAPSRKHVIAVPLYDVDLSSDFLKIVDEEMMNKAGWYRKDNKEQQ